MNKSNVQILMGVNGIKKAYQESLSEKALDIVCLSNNYEKVIGKYFDNEYAPKLYGGTIKTREILPDTKDNRNSAADKNKAINDTRFIGRQGNESDMLISDSKVTLVSYDQNDPYAVVITDKELVVGFKLQFEALWQGLK